MMYMIQEMLFSRQITLTNHVTRAVVDSRGEGPSSSGAVASNRNAICAGVVECSQPFTKSTGGTSNYVVGCAKLGNVKLYLQVIYIL